MTRKYELGQRAQAADDTRRRIVEAAVELHGTIGPSRTTVQAIADRAGVERKTYYRHFQDAQAIFDACKAHYQARNPPPDPRLWKTAREALLALYGFYGRNERMIANVMRDRELGLPFEGFEGLRDAAVDAVAGKRAGKARRAALTVVFDFRTWQTLAAAGLTEAQAVDAAARMAG